MSFKALSAHILLLWVKIGDGGLDQLFEIVVVALVKHDTNSRGHFNCTYDKTMFHPIF